MHGRPDKVFHVCIMAGRPRGVLTTRFNARGKIPDSRA
jgi:hypothetical protein